MVPRGPSCVGSSWRRGGTQRGGGCKRECFQDTLFVGRDQRDHVQSIKKNRGNRTKNRPRTPPRVKKRQVNLAGGGGCGGKTLKICSPDRFRRSRFQTRNHGGEDPSGRRPCRGVRDYQAFGETRAVHWRDGEIGRPQGGGDPPGGLGGKEKGGRCLRRGRSRSRATVLDVLVVCARAKTRRVDRRQNRCLDQKAYDGADAWNAMKKRQSDLLLGGRVVARAGRGKKRMPETWGGAAPCRESRGSIPNNPPCTRGGRGAGNRAKIGARGAT